MYARRASTYKAPPPSGGAPVPDHWWKLNQAAGTAVADEGALGTIDATTKGSRVGSSHTWLPSEDMNGLWIGALNQVPNASSTYYGDNRRVELNSNPPLNGVTALSFAIRINKDTSGVQPTDQRIFSQASDNAEAAHVLMFGFVSETTIRARIRRAGTTNTFLSSFSVTENTDIHLCFVLDFSEPNDELKIYHEGSLVDSIDVSGSAIDDSVSGTVMTAIGANKRAGEWASPFAGLMADARLWIGKALTAQEVSDVYNNV